MSRSGGYRELKVWQKAMDLVTRIYILTGPFPADERYGLTTQLRRAAVSVVANIAEGTGRATRGEFVNALSVARGSVKEVETLSEVASRLALMETTTFQKVSSETVEISRMISGLQRRARGT